MPYGLGSSFRAGGTRFRLFPELPSLDEQGEPETVWVSPRAGSVLAGPMDARMYVIDPIGKDRPYGFYPARNGGVIHYKPPWQGPAEDPAAPDSEGHFDHLEFGTRQFEQAHAYGTVRFALDVWENYFGRQIGWHFGEEYDRLEILFLRGLDNAYAGYGSLEIGSYEKGPGVPIDFGLSFDVIAHEVGHLIVYSEVGLPDTSGLDGEYFGFHESAADMASLISLMHFETALLGLLETSRGNLYTHNRLNRFGEISDSGQLRLASNQRTLYDFARGWRDEHDLSEPLTGAFFDIWVDVFHRNLVERGLIPLDLDELSDRLEGEPDYNRIVQPLFDRAYAAAPDGFARALAEARDYMGSALAFTWRRISPERLDYDDVFRAFLDTDATINRGRYRDVIEIDMRRRGIGSVHVGPRIELPAEDSHAFSPRTEIPLSRPRPCSHRAPYRLRMALARGPEGT